MRSIRRDEKHENTVKLLSEYPHPDGSRSVFPTMRELLCFAAVLGYHYGQKPDLGNKSIEIPARIFENSDTAMDLMFLIGLADRRDAEVLRDGNEDEVV